MRLSIKKDTLRNLALKSGNQCAFPGCKCELITNKDVFVGQVCHIESANEGGQRYNPKQTDEERRSINNLILFCYKHHKITDDTITYTVEKLKEIKENHENKSNFDIDDKQILRAIEKLESGQKHLETMLEQYSSSSSSQNEKSKGYKIVSPDRNDVWLPNQNELYHYDFAENQYVEYMMVGDLLCLTLSLPDGTEGYYEITEEGSVKECKLPYHISEYEIIIPNDMKVRVELTKLPNNFSLEKHILKYGRYVVFSKNSQGKVIEADFQARLRIMHNEKIIKILGKNDT